MRDVGAKMIPSIILRDTNGITIQGDSGIGKTRMVETASALISPQKAHIIEGNPDLTANQITGGEYIDPNADGTVAWKVSWGGMTEAAVVLLNEPDRAPPGTQSAFLGAMSEHRVTLQAPHVPKEQRIRLMPEVQIFLAAQNGAGHEGTYELPQAFQDRFLHHLVPGMLSPEAEIDLYMNPHKTDRKYLQTVAAKRVLTLAEIAQARNWVEQNITYSLSIAEHVKTIRRSTCPGSEEFKNLYENNVKLRPVLDLVQTGVSPRGAIALLKAARVQAYLFGKDKLGNPRNYVTIDDVIALIPTIFGPRILLNGYAATYSKGTGKDSVSKLDSYPPLGKITAEQAWHEVNRSGRNPLTGEHLLKLFWTHYDFTDRH
jgi:MoxR-like ATPase